MKELEFTITAEEEGSRIDKCIATRLGEEYSRTLVKNLIDEGLLTVNGENVKPRYAVCEGDKVALSIPSPPASDLEAEDIALDIIHEDESVIIVDKPAGMVVHPGAGNRAGTLVNALLHHCGKLPEADDETRPGIVHRIDKDTSGILVVAKNDRAMRSLARQFQKRTIKKKYLALVSGRVELDNGAVDLPLARHTTDRRKMTVEKENGKPAKTVYHVVKRFSSFTLLEIEPETGRTHQIRVHMKHIGHPVLGDATYGRAGTFKRHLLHAESIEFTHPDTGKRVEFRSPMPPDMKEIVEKGRL